jgi:hypothetical protein
MTVYENKRISISEAEDTYILQVKKSGNIARMDKNEKVLQGIISYAEDNGRFSISGKGKTAIRLWIDGKDCSLARFLYALTRDIPVSKTPLDTIRFADKDNTNCCFDNLSVRGDDIYCDSHRIYIEHHQSSERFFTYSESVLFDLLKNPAFTWYYHERARKEEAARKLLSATIHIDRERLFGNWKIPLSGLVWAYYNLSLRSDNIIEPLSELRKLFNHGYVIDHLRDNSRNNCPHNLSLMTFRENAEKKAYVTKIQLPYVFVPVFVDGEYRVLCGKFHNDGKWEWSKLFRCLSVEVFLKLLKEFSGYSKKAGDMRPALNGTAYTNCLSKMVTDDGEGEIQPLIDATVDCFEVYDAWPFPHDRD